VSHTGPYGTVFGTVTGRDENDCDRITWDDGALSVQRPGDPTIKPVRGTHPAAAPAITAEFVWTQRDGARNTGLLNFTADTPAGRAVLATTTNDREPQFHITGGTRRTTIDTFNDYDSTDTFTADKSTPQDTAARAAAWLGYTATVNVKIIDEYRQHP
ncbi:hypothetical protein, partial [Streptomyces sp. NPDC056670]|uniref:hypothetical protein n=1 Tax=Streptomyces sp. NPDC056670 TaxID=3345904 RepID=UPI00369FE20B